jgi:glutamate dehydrogenase
MNPLDSSGDKPATGQGQSLQTAVSADLFAATSPEDLALYGREEIAGFAASALTVLGRRAPGTHTIRISDPAFDAPGRRHREVTLVEIVNDNMPFLVDSVLGELQDFGAEIALVAHPIVTVRRRADGGLADYLGRVPAGEGTIRESLIQIHVSRLGDENRRSALAARLDSLLIEVRRAVADWPAMLKRLAGAIAASKAAPPPVAEEERAEALAFLAWLGEGNFTFLGMRDYSFAGDAETGVLKRDEASGLGILSDPETRVLLRAGEAVQTTPAIRAFLMRPEPLIITKANQRSRIHRRGFMDYIGVKLYGPNGALTGELRMVGLFTSTAYTLSARSIPHLRRKIDRIVARAGYDPASHSGKALVNILETYPRDELFQTDDETLFGNATAIVQLGERPRIRVLARHDEFDRFVSVLVYIPRDRYGQEQRVRIGALLAEAYGGHVTARNSAFPEGALARIHYIIGRNEGAKPHPDRHDLERAVAAIVETFADGLKRVFAAGATDPALARDLVRRYRDAFPPAYRDDFPPEAAAADIARLERLTEERPVAIVFTDGSADDESAAHLRLLHRGGGVTLSERVPILEAMGFRVVSERSYAIGETGAGPSHLHDMALALPDGGVIDLDRQGDKLTAAFLAIWYGQAESDGFNALVLSADLGWRDIAMLRTVGRYLLQGRLPYSLGYLAATLNRHPAIAAALAGLFHARFAGAEEDHTRAAGLRREIEKALEAVASLDEDRIIRAFAGVVEATVRTNFFRIGADGAPEAEIAIKIDCGKVATLPEPRPWREIFIHSPRLEAVHLRFGRIARGGIRWSDRPQDFRTEILGLAKAQLVKNAVIVPVGAKGGFVPKKLPAGPREAVMAEGVAAYRIFMERLLDLTDNLDGAVVVPPEGVARRDGDDPYLVVAADKGTATFSDIANGIATARGFWLGDAFASGGSAGYDHKAMGITARGAWESVKRHFREMDFDIQTTAFTAVGVGDMSGDVFGNGMMLSPEMKLIAAFDHRDIFLDPDPDPEKSLRERRRLFGQPRSSWQDYDRAAISPEGGVYSRQEKSIPLSPGVKARLGVAADRMTPQDLMKAILKAKVDLLWFGGIGTFVRSSEESDQAVGDRANDGIRITGREIRASVVGEGANLAVTQRGRIEYALAGGRINSDAIDNSAGVNTSDMEVNIKIGLAAAVRAGRLDLPARNALLKAMTADVAALVLRNNYLQTLAISLAARRGFEDFGFQGLLMRDLQARGILDRGLEALPDEAELAERRKAGKPLTRPEIGVLLALAKIALYGDLLDSNTVDDPALAAELAAYFPPAMTEGYRAEIEGHRLRREIVATTLANQMINRGGPTFVTRIGERTGAAADAVAKAFVAASAVFDLKAIHTAIDALDNQIGGLVQLDLYRIVEDLLHSRTAWFVRNESFADGIAPVIQAYRQTIEAIAAGLDDLLPPHLAEAAAAAARTHEDRGVPDDLARRLALLPQLADALDIHRIAQAAGRTVGRAAAVFYAVDDTFSLSRIEEAAGRIAVVDPVDGLALERALETVADGQRQIAAAAVAAGGAEEGDLLAAWTLPRKAAVERAKATIASLTGGETPTVSRVVVAAGILADLARNQERG